MINSVSNSQEAYTDTFFHAFDEKGRITVPSEWRSPAHETRLLVFPSQDKCLKVYPASWLANQIAKFKDAPVGDPRRKILEKLAGGAQTVVVDGQGRIMVKDKLRAGALLKKKSVLSGALDHFEIWDAQLWSERDGGTEMTFEQAALEAGL